LQLSEFQGFRNNTIRRNCTPEFFILIWDVILMTGILLVDEAMAEEGNNQTGTGAEAEAVVTRVLSLATKPRS
jgi:hypothetical protein